MTNLELEKKVQGVEKSLSEMQDAIRNLSQQDGNTLAILNKLSEEVNKFRAELGSLKAAVGKIDKTTKMSVSRYE